MSCKGCTKRHLGCHSNCEDYAEYMANAKEKANAKKEYDIYMGYKRRTSLNLFKNHTDKRKIKIYGDQR